MRKPGLEVPAGTEIIGVHSTEYRICVRQSQSSQDIKGALGVHVTFVGRQVWPVFSRGSGAVNSPGRPKGARGYVASLSQATAVALRRTHAARGTFHRSCRSLAYKRLFPPGSASLHQGLLTTPLPRLRECKPVPFVPLPGLARLYVVPATYKRDVHPCISVLGRRASNGGCCCLRLRPNASCRQAQGRASLC